MSNTSLPPHAQDNASMLLAALRIASAVRKLTERGLSVISANLQCTDRPTIHIRTSARCQQLIDSGDAVYYSFGHDTYFGKYRQGQFALEGCRIVWTEFGH
ncbi:hypothetical protein [Aquitalea sp. LB_tupeE]|uniref:hypothetical protein n=1 Tax=Aquitalea sp. LB_tupeE TaxID=2748078 RepID=UPI0015B8D891|nr:hypothetical protein [Aquitalea sp. LB_tupeE]NWK80336.1 hypothetical protein [Aquitalea sp. LB_tupeE]